MSQTEVRSPRSGEDAPPASVDHLTGAQKAAIVLLKLGRERSVSIMKLLGEHEVSVVTAEIVQAQAGHMASQAEEEQQGKEAVT